MLIHSLTVFSWTLDVRNGHLFLERSLLTKQRTQACAIMSAPLLPVLLEVYVGRRLQHSYVIAMMASPAMFAAHISPHHDRQTRWRGTGKRRRLDGSNIAQASTWTKSAARGYTAHMSRRFTASGDGSQKSSGWRGMQCLTCLISGGGEGIWMWLSSASGCVLKR